MRTLTARGTGVLRLRDYQEDAIAAMHSYPKKRLVVVAATGAGKTVIGSKFAVDRLSKGPILFLAHRDELLDQTLRKFEAVFDSFGAPGQTVRVGKIQAKDDDVEADFCVASVQTLKDPKRLARWIEAHPDTPTMITDECHHASTRTYQDIFHALGYAENEVLEKLDARHVGLTATPYRTDRKTLKGVFDGVAYAIGLGALIERQYLVPPRAVPLPLIEGLRDPASGDWGDEEIDERINHSAINQAIFSEWEKRASDRLTVGFAASIGHARALAETFASRGVPSAYVSGAMSKEERRAVLDDFAQGRLRALFNYGVLTEGFDQPEVSALIMARPTTSHGLYTQMAGRALRLAPHIGKEDALILDVVGVTELHRLMTVDQLLGGSVESGTEGGTGISQKLPERSGERNRLKAVDHTQYRWLSPRRNVWLLRDFDGRFVRVVKEASDRFVVTVGQWLSPYQRGQRETEGRRVPPATVAEVYAGPDVEMAWGSAATYAHVHLQSSAISPSERWMEQPPTSKQVEMLERRGVEVPENRWEAHHLLTQPSPRQEAALQKVFSRFNIPEKFLPDTADEASAMMDIAAQVGWRDLKKMMSGWSVELPHRFHKI